MEYDYNRILPIIVYLNGRVVEDEDASPMPISIGFLLDNAKEEMDTYQKRLEESLSSNDPLSEEIFEEIFEDIQGLREWIEIVKRMDKGTSYDKELNEELNDE